MSVLPVICREEGLSFTNFLFIYRSVGFVKSMFTVLIIN